MTTLPARGQRSLKVGAQTGSVDLPHPIWSTPARGKGDIEKRPGSLGAPGGLSRKLERRRHHGKEGEEAVGRMGRMQGQGQGRALLCIGCHRDGQPLPRLQAMSLVSWSLPRPLRLRAKFKHIQPAAILTLTPDTERQENWENEGQEQSRLK